jgi:hypothetical protein
MSSPKVLSWVTMPHDEAVAGNWEAMQHYLELARALYQQTREVERRTQVLLDGMTAAGGPEPMLSYDDAAATAHRLFEQTRAVYASGKPGVEFAHAYWQSLKHPWHEMVLHRHADVAAEQAERRAQEQERLARVMQGVDSSVRVQASTQRVAMHTRTDAVLHSWPERIEQVLATLHDHVREQDRAALEVAIADTADQPPDQRWLALEQLRLAQDQRAKARRIEAALQLFTTQRRELVAERMQAQVALCDERLGALASPRTEALQAELEVLRQRLDSPDLGEPDEDKLEELNRLVLQESARLRLLNDAVAQLAKMGYGSVQVMQTLSANDIASAFLEDPQDPERVALVQVSAQHGLMTAEVVRRTASDGSPTQRHADHSAQVRLCQAMAQAEAALAERWQLQVRSDKPPGAPVQQAKVALPQRKAKVRRAAAQRARQIGG